MIKSSKNVIGDLSVLTLGDFNLYNEIEDRIYLKSIVRKLFAIDDEVFFFFRREESLTEENELVLLRQSIFKYFKENGDFKYLLKLDDRRFDAIAKIIFDPNTPNFILILGNIFIPAVFLNQLMS